MEARTKRRGRYAGYCGGVRRRGNLLMPAVAGANGNGQQVSFTLDLRGAAAGWGRKISGRKEHQPVTCRVLR